MFGDGVLVLAEYIHGANPTCLHELIRVVLGINAERQQRRLKRHLHDPGGSKGIASLAGADADHIDAVTDVLK